MNKNSALEKKFSAKQLIMLETLTLLPDVQTAAKQTGIGKSTIYKWLRQEDFKARLVEKRTEILDDSVDQIKSYCRKALQRIAGLMDSENESVVMKASTYLLDKALEVKQTQEFEERILMLETKIVKKGGNRYEH
jgi:hypothetical protein